MIQLSISFSSEEPYQAVAIQQSKILAVIPIRTGQQLPALVNNTGEIQGPLEIPYLSIYLATRCINAIPKNSVSVWSTEIAYIRGYKPTTLQKPFFSPN